MFKKFEKIKCSQKYSVPQDMTQTLRVSDVREPNITYTYNVGGVR